MGSDRLKGWERRFHDALEFELSRPFSWDLGNCGHVITCAIRACYGEHQVLQYLYECRDEQTTLDMLQREGGLEGILSQWFEPIHHSLAQEADIGIVIGRFYDKHSTEYVNQGIGCVITGGKAVGKREVGNFYLPLDRVHKVFRLG